MIKAALFDFGGVMFNIDKSKSTLHKETGYNLESPKEIHELYKKKVATGKIPAEKFFEFTLKKQGLECYYFKRTTVLIRSPRIKGPN